LLDSLLQEKIDRFIKSIQHQLRVKHEDLIVDIYHQFTK